MMNSKVAVVFFLTMVVCTIANRVLDLTDENFSSSIGNIDATLVMFDDLRCTHCAKLSLEFDKVRESLRGTNQPFTLAKVDCNESGKETCLKYSITVEEYPILKIFRMGQLGPDYDGSHDAAGIAKFMKRRYGAPSTELFTLAEIEEFVNTQESTVIAFFEKGSDYETFFLQYADNFKEDYRFGHCSAADVLSKHNEKNSIELFRAPQFHNKFEPNSVTFKGDSDDELTSFLKKNCHGLVGHRKTDNVHDFEHPNVIVYYAVDYVNNVKKTNYWRNRILQVAVDNTDYRFAISSSAEFRLELEKFGHGYLGEKPLVTAHDNADRVFKMTAAFSIETLKQFVSDVKEGKLEPFIKSEAIPTTNDGPVKIAVAKNFNEIVINNGKDTFLEIYAPWCGYCKELAPVLDELGTKMIGEDVEIVKFDATNNEVPQLFNLQGYPSLFWMPKNSKNKPLMYSGVNDLENFIKYIAKHATGELKNYDRSGEIKKTEL